MFCKGDYFVDGKVVKRISPVEVAPREKRNLLKKTIEHYTGKEKPNPEEFEFCGECEDDNDVNCICSQTINHSNLIKHKPTGLYFRCGRVCFEDLYNKSELGLHFWKPWCKYCQMQKVENRRTLHGKEGFCSKKCWQEVKYNNKCALCNKYFWKVRPEHKLCKLCWKKSFFGYK